MQSTSGRMKANTVRDISSARKTEFKRTASVLRAQIDTQIMEAASQGAISVLIDIPRHYMGREPYDWIQMGQAIVSTLLEDGYYISGTYLRFRLTWERSIVSCSTKKQQQQPQKKPIFTIPSIKLTKRR